MLDTARVQRYKMSLGIKSYPQVLLQEKFWKMEIVAPGIYCLRTKLGKSFQKINKILKKVKKGAKRRGKEIINKLLRPFAPQLFTTTFWPLLRQFQRNLRDNVWSHPRQPKNEQFSQLSIKRGMTICFVLNFMRKKFRRGQKGGRSLGKIRIPVSHEEKVPKRS